MSPSGLGAPASCRRARAVVWSTPARCRRSQRKGLSIVRANLRSERVARLSSFARGDAPNPSAPSPIAPATAPTSRRFRRLTSLAEKPIHCPLRRLVCWAGASKAWRLLFQPANPASWVKTGLIRVEFPLPVHLGVLAICTRNRRVVPLPLLDTNQKRPAIRYVIGRRVCHNVHC